MTSNNPRSIMDDAMEQVAQIWAMAEQETGPAPVPQKLLRQATDEAILTPDGIERLVAAVGEEEAYRQIDLARKRTKREESA